MTPDPNTPDSSTPPPSEQPVWNVQPAIRKQRKSFVRAMRRKAARWLTPEQNQALVAMAEKAITETPVL